MKRLFKPLRSFLFALTLFLALTALPAYTAQQQPQWKSGNGQPVSVPAAKDLALKRAAQQQLAKSRYKGSTPLSTVTFGNLQNWSGWMAGSGSGNGFQGVEGNWNAPCTSGTNDQHRTYTSWVGLGGLFNGEHLEQAGIILEPDGTYRLFWEYTPDLQVIDTGDVIHCRDSLTAWVHYGTGYCSNGGFQAHVQDNTTGAHWGTPNGCITESRGYGIQSAEWIDERFYSTCQFPQLADFNWTGWSNVQAQPNYSGAVWRNPMNYSPTQWLMYDDPSAQYLAYPDGIQVNSDNTFIDRWYNYGTAC